MPSRIDPAAATNAFARQVQLGANMRASDQAEEMNALQLDRMRAQAKPQYDPAAFQKVGGLAAQISSLQDPAQKRLAFKTAIAQNGALFDTLGMPSADALAKLDTLDDAGLEATLAKLASFAPQAAPIEVSAGASLVRPSADGGYEAAFTAPTAAKGEDGFSLSPGQVRFDAQGKRIAGVDPAPEKVNPNDAFNHAATLRDDYRQESMKFRDVADAYQRISDSAADPSAAGDIALLFNYLKVLDPGSTVREGEFATVAQSGGLPSRVQSLYNKMVNGMLPNDVRKDVVSRATQLYKGQEGRFKTQVFDRYQGLAKRYGIDPSEFGDPRAQIPTAAPAPAAAAPGQPVRVNTPEEAAKLPPGTVFITPDGRRKVVPNG